MVTWLKRLVLGVVTVMITLFLLALFIHFKDLKKGRILLRAKYLILPAPDPRQAEAIRFFATRRHLENDLIREYFFSKHDDLEGMLFAGAYGVMANKTANWNDDLVRELLAS